MDPADLMNFVENTAKEPGAGRAALGPAGLLVQQGVLADAPADRGPAGADRGPAFRVRPRDHHSPTLDRVGENASRPGGHD